MTNIKELISRSNNKSYTFIDSNNESMVSFKQVKKIIDSTIINKDLISKNEVIELITNAIIDDNVSDENNINNKILDNNEFYKSEVRRIVKNIVDENNEALADLRLQELVNYINTHKITNENKVNEIIDNKISENNLISTSKVDEMINNNSDILNQKINESKEYLLDSLNSVETSLSEKINRDVNNINESITNVNDNLNSSKEELHNAISIKAQEINQTNSEKINKLTENINRVYGNKFKEYSKELEIAKMSDGKILYTDPTFKKGFNGITVNDLNNSGLVSLNRVNRSDDNPTTSTYELLITTKGNSYPGYGGFRFSTQTRPNAIFYTRIIAKIPIGYNIGFSSGKRGDNSSIKFITDNKGTGKWKDYLVRLNCGNTGTFEITNFFHIEGSPTPTVNNPVQWRVAFATVYDFTDFDDTNVLKSDFNIEKQLVEEKINLLTTSIENLKSNNINSNNQNLFLNKITLNEDDRSIIINYKDEEIIINSDSYFTYKQIERLRYTVLNGDYLVIRQTDENFLNPQIFNFEQGKGYKKSINYLFNDTLEIYLNNIYNSSSINPLELNSGKTGYYKIDGHYDYTTSDYISNIVNDFYFDPDSDFKLKNYNICSYYNYVIQTDYLFSNDKLEKYLKEDSANNYLKERIFDYFDKNNGKLSKDFIIVKENDNYIKLYFDKLINDNYYFSNNNIGLCIDNFISNKYYNFYNPNSSNDIYLSETITYSTNYKRYNGKLIIQFSLPEYSNNLPRVRFTNPYYTEEVPPLTEEERILKITILPSDYISQTYLLPNNSLKDTVPFKLTELKHLSDDLKFEEIQRHNVDLNAELEKILGKYTNNYLSRGNEFFLIVDDNLQTIIDNYGEDILKKVEYDVILSNSKFNSKLKLIVDFTNTFYEY